MTRRAQRKFLDRVNPAFRESLQSSLAAGFEPPAITSFTMTGASSLYGDGGTHYEHEHWTEIEPVLATPAPRRVPGETFERLTRKLANTSSRRQALKVLGGAAAAAVGAAVLKPAGVAMAEVESCPAGHQVCGKFCCPSRYTCSSTSSLSSCCCPPATTPCGPSCCPAGVACLNKTKGQCGCSAGKTPCGTGANLRCCPAGTACPGTNSTTECPAANSATLCVGTNSVPC